MFDELAFAIQMTAERNMHLKLQRAKRRILLAEYAEHLAAQDVKRAVKARHGIVPPSVFFDRAPTKHFYKS